jgi:gliding motility-associated-like protein
MRGSGCNVADIDAAAEKLEYTYTVTEATAILKYRFAAVLHIPDQGGEHKGDERPYFEIQINVTNPDGSTAEVPCSSYTTVVNEYSSLLKRGTVPTGGCTASKGIPNEYMFQPWTSALVDLREHIGSQVTITVITHDCLVRCTNNTPAAGGHEAYGYFRAEAMDINLATRVCNEEDAQIAAPAGFASYKWSRSDHFTMNTYEDKPNIAYIPANIMLPNIVYTCELSDELGCAAIKVNTKLDPVILKPSFDYTTYCGGKVKFESTSTASGDNMISWIWDAGEGEVSGEVSDHTYSKPGDYEVTLTATTENGCKQTFTKTISVPYFPDLKINADPNVCNGKEINVSAVNIELDSKIEWSSSLAGQTFPEINSFVTTPTQSQIYSIKVTDQRNCVYTASKEVRVFDKTHVYIKGVDHICPTKEAKLELIGSDLTDINWNIPNTKDQQIVSVFPNETSTYTVNATDKNGCEVNASHIVNVYERPTLNFEVPLVCQGSDVTIKATGAQSYLWHHPDFSSYSGGEITIKNIQETTTILVTGYSPDGCTNSQTVTALVQQMPVVTIEGTTERCFNTEPFIINAYGADEYIWNSTEISNTFTAPSDRNHTVSVVGKIGTCESEPVKVELNTIESPKITALQENITICDGNEVTLQVSGAEQYQWYNTTETSSTLVVAPTESKTYTVKGISADGCISNEVDINVTVNHADQVTLHIEKAIACPGKPDSAVVVAQGALKYEWSSIPEIEGVSFNKSDALHVNYDTPTIIKVKGTNELACSSTAEIELTLLPEPKFEFKVEPTYVDESKPYVHLHGLSPYSENSKWHWNMGDGSNILQARDTIYTYDISRHTEPFMLEVTAYDENGCKYEGEAEIKIWKESWAPDAFSPNGDGINDRFGFYRTEYITTCEFYIYNRLGEVVYEGHSKDDKWDGTYQGKPCPWGTYGWVLNYTSTIDGDTREGVLKGQVTIIK